MTRDIRGPRGNAVDSGARRLPPGPRMPASSGLSRRRRDPTPAAPQLDYDYVNSAANKLRNSRDHRKYFRSCRQPVRAPGPMPHAVLIFAKRHLVNWMAPSRGCGSSAIKSGASLITARSAERAAGRGRGLVSVEGTRPAARHRPLRQRPDNSKERGAWRRECGAGRAGCSLRPGEAVVLRGVVGQDGSLDQPVGAVTRQVHLALVGQRERRQVHQVVVLVRQREPHFAD